MPVITFQDFGLGKDLRKGASVADANRLRELKNGYVTTGKAIRKRPGTSLIAKLETGTTGLIPGLGKLHTFTEATGISHSNALFEAHQVSGSNVNPAVFTGSGLNDLSSGGSYNGAGTPTFTIVIDGVVTGAITVFAANGATSTTVTSTGHGRSNGNLLTIIGTTSYNGSHSISGVTANTYNISVAFIADDATGTWELNPNTFKWKKDSGAFTTGVSITALVQNLQEGVQVTFGALTGHTLADSWTALISSTVDVTKVHFGDVFNGFLYTVIEYTNATILHHYLDGSTVTKITDPNCPQSKAAVKIESKIWAINGDTVAFSATGNPRDWTTSQDAGFLPVGLKQRGADESLALGQYQVNKLVVFFKDGAQLWTVDPDPALHVFSQLLPGSSTRYHRGIANLFQDLYFLSDYGFRSISEAALTGNQAEFDIGSPIDEVIQPLLPIADTHAPEGIFNPKLGQYMSAIGSTVYTFTFSRTAKISAWGEYEYPWTIHDTAVLDGEVYYRSGNNVYKSDDTLNLDGVETGKTITVFATNGSGGTTVTSTAHGRANSDKVTIAGTTSYNGTNTISSVTTNTFDISVAFVGNDATGTYTVGTPFECEIGFAFFDAKKPGVMKMWRGVDSVSIGDIDLNFRFDPRDETEFTETITLTGDTRPGELAPVEIASTSLSPLVKNSNDEEFQLDALSMVYENLRSL